MAAATNAYNKNLRPSTAACSTLKIRRTRRGLRAKDQAPQPATRPLRPDPDPTTATDRSRRRMTACRHRLPTSPPPLCCSTTATRVTVLFLSVLLSLIIYVSWHSIFAGFEEHKPHRSAREQRARRRAERFLDLDAKDVQCSGSASDTETGNVLRFASLPHQQCVLQTRKTAQARLMGRPTRTTARTILRAHRRTRTNTPTCPS